MNQVVSSQLVAGESDLYQQAFAQLNAAVPHRQGMGETELLSARSDPRTLLASSTTRPEVQVPVATPLSVYEWISADYFSTEYPAIPGSDLYHLCSNERLLDQVEQEPILRWLRHLAEESHLLVVDFPRYDGPEDTRLRGALPAAIADLLDAAGLQAEDARTIGVQHYYDATLVIRDRSKLSVGDVDLSRSYRDGLADGAFDSFTRKGVKMLDVVEGKALQEAWDLYETYIGGLNYVTPIVESLDYATFEREMKDPRVNKFVSMRDGQLKCMMFLSSDLARYDWLSPTYLLEHHFQDVERGSVFEFPCFFTTADARGLTHTSAVLRLASHVFALAGVDAKIKFDCPTQTHISVKTVVREFVNRGAVAEIEPTETCQQHFVAFKLKARQNQPAVVETANEISWGRFDPQIYVADNYLSVSPEDRVIVERLADFYADLDVAPAEGKQLDVVDVVEVGGGPNLYPVLASLLKADRVTIVEHGSRNVAYAAEQLRNLSPNWMLFWEALAARQPAYRQLDLAEALAAKVTVRQQSLFDYQPDSGRGCDVVSTHFCVESITSTLEGFQRGLRALWGMTRPGGGLIASFLKGSEGYSVGAEIFPAFPLFEDDLVDSLEQVGYRDVSLAAVENSGALSNDHEWLGMFVVEATRPVSD